MSDETRKVPTGPGEWWRDADGNGERIVCVLQNRSRLVWLDCDDAIDVTDDGRWIAPVLTPAEADALRERAERAEEERDRYHDAERCAMKRPDEAIARLRDEDREWRAAFGEPGATSEEADRRDTLAWLDHVEAANVRMDDTLVALAHLVGPAMDGDRGVWGLVSRVERLAAELAEARMELAAFRDRSMLVMRVEFDEADLRQRVEAEARRLGLFVDDAGGGR